MMVVRRFSLLHKWLLSSVTIASRLKSVLYDIQKWKLSTKQVNDNEYRYNIGDIHFAYRKQSFNVLPLVVEKKAHLPVVEK